MELFFCGGGSVAMTQFLGQVADITHVFVQNDLFLKMVNSG